MLSRTTASNARAFISRFAATSRRQPVRNLNIHEYQAVALMEQYRVPTIKGIPASTPQEAEDAANQIGGPDFVVKAQCLTGGRGKGHFDSGYQGGVHTANSALEVNSLAAKMLGNRLITKQTGAEGKPCNQVMVVERLYLRRETYFAILMDRETAGPVMVASSEGGMNIEDVAAETPELIHKLAINIKTGPEEAELEILAKKMGFDKPETVSQATTAMKGLYEAFISCDSTLIEINPLAETHDGRVLCIDAKFNFDDNAYFRQKEIFQLRDPSQEDPREVQAEKFDLNYIGLDGSIGCLVNGAGLAMATMDAIMLSGGSPANFLDVGGGANKNQITEAVKILNNDERVKAILVNIFGGIMRCDVIALGLISAATELGIKKPLVVRLAGTNVEQAKQLIEESGLRMLTADDLGEAAQKACRVVEIVKMAEASKLDVSFEIPL